MTSFRMVKTLKSGVAVIVSGSLFVTTAVMPVAAQTFRAGTTSGAGSSARGSFTPATLNGVQPLPAALLGSASLTPALSPALAPAALTLPLPAAAKGDETPGARQPANPPSAPVDPKGTPAKSDSGPRWVKTEPKAGAPAAEGGPRWVKTEEKKAADAGPRWVGPQKTGVRAVLAKFLPFLGRSGSETFDGASERRDDVEDASVASKGEASRPSSLAKPSVRAARIINDSSIPTPEAARRVGEIRHEHGTPIWAKIVAPLSVIAAVAVAIHFGAVPVLTLAVGLVISVLAHEIAHIAVLHRLGDHTAEHAEIGRASCRERV